MTVAIGDIVRINCNFQWLTSDFFTNGYYLQVTHNTSSTDLLFMGHIADHFDALYTLVNADVADSISYVDVQGQNITQNLLLPSVAWPVLTVGLETAQALPTQIAPYVFWRTLRPKTRSAVYVPGYTEDANSAGGAIVAAAVTRLQSFADAHLVGVREILVEADAGAYNVALDRFTEASAAVGPSRFATQRRRRLGVGS